MPRPRTAHGRPSTAVFPHGWTTTGGAVIDGTLDCTVTVGPAGGAAGWDPDTRTTTTEDATPVYTGAASIEPATASTGPGAEAAGDDVPVAGYVVTLSLATTGADVVAAGHVIRVSASTRPALVGKTLQVVSVDLDSRAFGLTVHADLND